MTNLGVYLAIVGIVWSITTILGVALHWVDRSHRWF